MTLQTFLYHHLSGYDHMGLCTDKVMEQEFEICCKALYLELLEFSALEKCYMESLETKTVHKSLMLVSDCYNNNNNNKIKTDPVFPL